MIRPTGTETCTAEGGRREGNARSPLRYAGDAKGARSSAWLERTPDKREVGGSNPPGPIRRKPRLTGLSCIQGAGRVRDRRSAVLEGIGFPSGLLPPVAARADTSIATESAGRRAISVGERDPRARKSRSGLNWAGGSGPIGSLESEM